MATCKQECSCSSFGMGGTEPALFANPQARWIGMPWTFIVYRLAIAIYQLTFLILTLVYWGTPPLYSRADNKAKWLIYVSNWSYLYVTAYFLMAAITTIYWQLTHGKQIKDKPQDVEMTANNQGARVEDGPPEASTTPWYFKLQRYFQIFACSGSTFVTILYWVLEYDPADGDVVQVFSLHVHGIAATLLIIDTLLIATPFRILHMIYVMITAFFYFCFTAVYHAAGGLNPSGETHIYKGFLDWGGAPGTSAIVGAIVVFVAAPFFHTFYYALYRLRLAFGKCCSCCTYQNS